MCSFLERFRLDRCELYVRSAQASGVVQANSFEFIFPTRGNLARGRIWTAPFVCHTGSWSCYSMTGEFTTVF